MDAKNWIYIILKNYSQKDFLKYFFPITIERLRNLSGLIKNTPLPQILPSILSTYGEIILKLPRIISKRHHLQKLLISYCGRPQTSIH